jgi:hypothetical protein
MNDDKIIKRLWDAIQEDGENLDFETFAERVKEWRLENMKLAFAEHNILPIAAAEPDDEVIYDEKENIIGAATPHPRTNKE